MSKIDAKAYLSPSLVLLAMDWKDGEGRNDFLGFAISRSPGFKNLATGTVNPSDWLPNRLTFIGPPPNGQPDPPSNIAPIQKFMWWDARLDGFKAGDILKYTIVPVCGTPQNNQPVDNAVSTLEIALPDHVENDIGTWFNRAVMSSQSFSRKVTALGLAPGQAPDDAQTLELRSWLSNGMEVPVPGLIKGAGDSLAGAIYHLTDDLWIRPALKAQMKAKNIGLVYDAVVQKDNKGKILPNVSQDAIDELTDVTFHERDKTNIMHNKFLVSGTDLLSKNDAEPVSLTCGSANYHNRRPYLPGKPCSHISIATAGKAVLGALQISEGQSRQGCNQKRVSGLVQHCFGWRRRHPGVLFARAGKAGG